MKSGTTRANRPAVGSGKKSWSRRNWWSVSRLRLLPLRKFHKTQRLWKLMTNSRAIRLGIIGLHNHYHIYPMARYAASGLDRLQFVGVYDERLALAGEFAQLYNIPTVHASADELLSRSDVDGIIITSSTASHHRDVLAAVKHKKHILLDKPIAVNTAEAAEMVRVAEDAKVVFMMAYLIRYLPAYKKAKELIVRGVI